MRRIMLLVLFIAGPGYALTEDELQATLSSGATVELREVVVLTKPLVLTRPWTRVSGTANGRLIYLGRLSVPAVIDVRADHVALLHLSINTGGAHAAVRLAGHDHMVRGLMIENTATCGVEIREKARRVSVVDSFLRLGNGSCFCSGRQARDVLFGGNHCDMTHAQQNAHSVAFRR